MVVGIVACCIPFAVPIIGPFLGLPAGIVALVLGIIANRECTREPQRFKGKGMAITGIVLGAIMCVMGLLLILAVTIGIGALEDYCEENPDLDGCDEFNDQNAATDVDPLRALGHRLGAVAPSILPAGRSLT